MTMLLSWLKVKSPKFSKKQKAVGYVPDEVMQLKKDIDEARRGWQAACRFFEYVVEPDEVDYAVYHLMATEQRYIMLIRKAKAMTSVQWPAWVGGE
ncbi:DUF2508 family protein [Paenibacillus kobensis]|uniref:DUF2508 family protein n=1 Tax=Paenibacillus kobensis TaxID=59841 RepID=UPI0013E2CCD3|nr:DUF2508 family protein [Paenibacillus kobensis]